MATLNITTPENTDTTNGRANRPDSASLAHLVEAGTAALNDGNLGLALDKFEAVVAAFPERPEGHNNLGALYNSIGDYERAEECFERVLEILPGNPNILYNRGVARSRLEKFDGAREDFTAVLGTSPQDADTLNNLGVTHFMQGHFPAAREAFEQALDVSPDYENALLNLIDLECAAGQRHRAIEQCESHLATRNSIAVRRKHFELLSDGCRDALEKASRVAESILVADKEDQGIRAELGRITRAQAIWRDSTPTI